MDAEWVIASCAFAGLLGTLAMAADRWLHKPDNLRQDFDAKYRQLVRDLRQLDKDIGQVRDRMDKAHERYGLRDQAMVNQLLQLEVKLARLDERTDK